MEHTADAKPNRLIDERSPYLRQHSYNPVDWYPWGEQAFERARKEHKPIFLSIGYSTCHWCHVMERESFTDTSVAEYLNSHFISIKLDREERPDIDAIYMSATQAMTGSGGWPMSVFLTPDLKPFFCGTYYPPEPRYGRPSFLELLHRINEVWTTRYDDVIRSAEELTSAIISIPPTNTTADYDLTDISDRCYQHLALAFDSVNGGFGGAPKFPRPAQISFLFTYAYREKNETAAMMALTTLDAMVQGGMYDHIGGGFHRYSVDDKWFVPHFEKMLYDQAQLVHLYLDAFQLTGRSKYADIVRETCDFVLRELHDSDGGFFSALDADSEGEEGTYYVWTLEEIQSILGDDASMILNLSDISADGNWEDGKNIYRYCKNISDAANLLSLSSDEANRIIHRAERKLYEARSQRIRPYRDEKIITAWNGLMIGALSRAGLILNDDRYITAAINAAQYILHHNYRNGELLQSSIGGERGPLASVDAYAFFIDGLLHLYSAVLDERYLLSAIELQDQQNRLFFDETNGGYYTGREGSDLIVRTKNQYDGAEPASSTVSLLNLMKLTVITGTDKYIRYCEETIKAFISNINKYPYTMPLFVANASFIERQPGEMIISGNIRSIEWDSLKRKIASKFMPDTVLYLPTKSPVFNEFAKSLVNDEKITIYYCRVMKCSLPISTVSQLDELLAQHSYFITQD